MNKTSGKNKIESRKTSTGRGAHGPNIVSAIQRTSTETPKHAIPQSKTKAIPSTSNAEISKATSIVGHVASMAIAPGVNVVQNNMVIKRKASAGNVNTLPFITKNESFITKNNETVKIVNIPVNNEASNGLGVAYITNSPQISHNLPSNISITPLPINKTNVRFVQLNAIPSKVIQKKVQPCAHCKKPCTNAKFCDTCRSSTASVSSSPVIVKGNVDLAKQDQSSPVQSKVINITKEKFYGTPTSSSQIITANIVGNSTFPQSFTPRKIFVTSDTQGKARGRPKGSKNKVTEPECLTISSDEEEHGKDNLETSSNQTTKRNCTTLPRGGLGPRTNPNCPRRSYRRIARNETEIVEQAEEGEIIEEEIAEDEEEEEEEEMDEEENLDEENSRVSFSEDEERQGQVKIHCRSIRIGSFKCHPINDESHLFVHVSPDSLSFKISKVTKVSDLAFITLKESDISQVLGHFGRCLPIIYIFTTSACAVRIRNKLGMELGSPFYYDPGVNDEKQKKITLLIESITEESKNFLRNVFPGERLLKEIDQKAANEILVKSTPSQIGQKPLTQTFQLPPNVVVPPTLQVQPSTPITQPIQNAIQNLPAQVTVQPITPKENSPNEAVNECPLSSDVRKIVTYPPPPETDSIELNTSDLVTLNEEEFLNDKIIDFYLRYLVLEKLQESDRERTHVFNSYFYRGLTQKPNKRASEDRQKSIAELRHRQVRNWTKNLNIFEKDFIIIPINQSAHWFLAIICYPKLATETKKMVKTDNSLTEQSNNSSQMLINTISPVKSNDENEESSSLDTSTQNSTTENGEVLGKRNAENIPPPGSKMPFIILFDSLPGPSRSQVLKTLKEYLEWEWKFKNGNSSAFNTSAILHGIASVPQQTNFSDCGIYVLQYVESFFEDPFPYIAEPLPDMKEWFSAEKIATKREEIRALIYELEKRLPSSVNNSHGEDNVTNSSRNS